jgi:hypothetical protein
MFRRLIFILFFALAAVSLICPRVVAIDGHGNVLTKASARSFNITSASSTKSVWSMPSSSDDPPTVLKYKKRSRRFVFFNLLPPATFAFAFHELRMPFVQNDEIASSAILARLFTPPI